MSYRKTALFTRILAIIIGNIGYAFSIHAFVISRKICIGGITGLGILAEKLTGLNAESFILIANILVLILGFFTLGPVLVGASVASSILYPLFLGAFRLIPGLDVLTQDTMLCTIMGGAGLGLSAGLLMRNGASTGGGDIICLTLHKFLHLPVSVFLFLFDCSVILLQIFFVDSPEAGLYGLVFTFIVTTMVDKVMMAGRSQIQVTVVSDKSDRIRQIILSHLDLGVTMLHIETGLRGEEGKAVMCVAHPRELYRLQKEILSIDSEAFITVMQVKEVSGQGFTRERQSLFHGQRTLL